MESGETIEQTALREIQEETGIQGKIIRPIEVIYYQYYNPDHGQVDKEVHYFLVEAVDGELSPQMSEINKARWFRPKDAWDLQMGEGYGNNHSVVQKALDQLGIEL